MPIRRPSLPRRLPPLSQETKTCAVNPRKPNSLNYKPLSPKNRLLVQDKDLIRKVFGPRTRKQFEALSQQLKSFSDSRGFYMFTSVLSLFCWQGFCMGYLNTQHTGFRVCKFRVLCSLHNSHGNAQCCAYELKQNTLQVVFLSGG